MVENAEFPVCAHEVYLREYFGCEDMVTDKVVQYGESYVSCLYYMGLRSTKHVVLKIGPTMMRIMF